MTESINFLFLKNNIKSAQSQVLAHTTILSLSYMLYIKLTTEIGIKNK